MKLIVLTSLLLCFITQPVNAEQQMIPKSKLQEMFNNIRVKTKWNMDKDMVWGYFFTSASQDALDKPSKELASLGYKVVAIYPSDDKSIYWLHVERIETHSVDSLYKRNAELYQFASKYNSVQYDGMDVGPVGLSK